MKKIRIKLIAENDKNFIFKNLNDKNIYQFSKEDFKEKNIKFYKTFDFEIKENELKKRLLGEVIYY